MFSKEQPILVLPPEEARRIAAGEVIDKPAAQVREFLDNAIDSGGSFIELLIEDGGIRLTEVVDNGCGMDKEDLALCWYTHATSKIRCLDDLKTARTLGFRGEALAAVAAVARLEILSSRDGRGAWKLSVGPGEKTAPLLEAAQRTAGTSVRSLGLYDTIPARKRFLKRPGSEAAACRQIFNEKALAFPEIGFRFTQDGVLKSFLPAVPSYKERFRQIFLQENEGGFLHEIAAGGAGFSVSIVAGGQELFRSDRRLQFVFANDRRIQDFSLLQALEYGLQGWFPNGTHPMGAVFVSIDPALADFNIHPAKREARFLDPGAIHHAVTSALRDFCRAKLLHDTSRNAAVSVATSGTTENLGSRASYLAMEALLANTPDFAPLPGRSANCSAEFAPVPGRDANFSADFATLPNAAGLGAEFAAEASAPYQTEGAARYLGRLFGVFILVEKGERLFIIDQHATHERLLYERFLGASVPRQELLVAIPFSTESPDDDIFLENKQEELAKLGIVIRREQDGWLIETLPSLWKLSDRETVTEILNLKTSRENLVERWAADVCCRRAVMDGDYLDGQAALSLAEEAFALPSPRCPHGRPLWMEISRLDVLRAVKRA